MENFLRNTTTGTMETIDAKYELLKRGEYTMNIHADRLTPITTDLRGPLQLRAAREAIAIAKAQGADRYAADTMQKAAIDPPQCRRFLSQQKSKGINYRIPRGYANGRGRAPHQHRERARRSGAGACSQ